MFGEEVTPNLVRPLRPRKPKEVDEHPAFFEPDRRLQTVQSHSESVGDPSLPPEVVFDPSATGTYPIDLRALNGNVIDLTAEGRRQASTLDAQRPHRNRRSTNERSVVYIKNPQHSAPKTQTARGVQRNAGRRPPVGQPENGAWPQPTPFQGHSSSPSLAYVKAANVDGFSSQGIARDGIGSSLAGEWFRQPVVWLVGGLLVIVILFLGLLFQDQGGLKPDVSTVIEAPADAESGDSTTVSGSPPSVPGFGGRTGSGNR